MDYCECQFQLKPYRPYGEILIAHLSEIGFESFEEQEESNCLKAFIEQGDYDEKTVREILDNLEGIEYKFNFKVVEKENWNKKWESNFQPVLVDDFCCIRAPFHQADLDVEYDIIIEPKMSFGTGHHQTTFLMTQLLRDTDLLNKSVLDMGSGTGVLAVLASKMGASLVDAIDIEEWAFENMKENFTRNKVEVSSFLGNASLLKGKKQTYDVVMANINKNILLRDLKHYDEVLNGGGFLMMSGFFHYDVEEILNSEVLNNYRKIASLEKDEWVAIKLLKIESVLS